VQARDLAALFEEIERSREQYGLASDSRVVSCYEAGRDGFWLHRLLCASGVENHVIDAGSMERQVRRRQVKTDRIDGERLLRFLMTWDQTGERVWSEVHVPSAAAEDHRHLSRELKVLQGEAQAHRNRLSSLLVAHGLKLQIDRHFLARVERARQWDGAPLPAGLTGRLVREWERLEQVRQQRLALERERREQVRTGTGVAIEQCRRLMQLRGIGIEGGWVLSAELFGWREFRNRRQIGGLLGLTPTPYQSGAMAREQGIDKAGISRVRTLAVELAWCWLRHQPDSELSRWYRERFGPGSSRHRKVGIVALARKLVVALWRYLDQGLVPEGARFKRVV
jgi:transposase